MTHILEVLDSSGHLTLTWDPSDTEQVRKAREEVERLRAAGYSFFAVVGSQGADEVEAGNGTLIVQRVESPFVQVPAQPEAKPPKKGRPPKVAPAPATQPPTRTIAMRPMKGG